MSSHPIPATPQRLLDLLDAQGALLAEFDYFPEQQLLWVRWFGYLTEANVVGATQAAVALRAGGMAPRRLLSDESRATGDWQDAMPWMQHQWFPNAVEHGLRAMAFVLSARPITPPNYWNFLLQARPSIAFNVFHTSQSAWRWLVHQG